VSIADLEPGGPGDATTSSNVSSLTSGGPEASTSTRAGGSSGATDAPMIESGAAASGSAGAAGSGSAGSGSTGTAGSGTAGSGSAGGTEGSGSAGTAGAVISDGGRDGGDADTSIADAPIDGDLLDARRDEFISTIDANIPTDVSRLGGASCGGIEYPQTGFYGENFLDPSYVTVNENAQMEMAAKLGVGASLRIRLTRVSGSVWYIGTPATEWRASAYDHATGVQLFEAPDMGRSDEETFLLPDSGSLLVEYFECGATTPTGVKILSWSGGPPGPLFGL
jgi:hypothetical protein